MDNQTNFDYDAFLSYSRKDVERAQKLSKRIRRYIPPKNIGLKKRQLKVFRDTERLTASLDLADNLKEQLLTSKHLVLLCSPNTATSNWVDKEVQAFLNTRNKKFIIFVLISGDFNNCLPPTLSGIEAHPLYIDLTGSSQKKFRTESLRLIAALYNIDFMSLLREDEARRRRIIRGVALISAIFIFMLLSAYLVLSVDPIFWNRIKQPEFGNANHLIDIDPIHEIAINKKEPANILYLTKRFGSSDDSATYYIQPAENPEGFDSLTKVFLQGRRFVTQVAVINFEIQDDREHNHGKLEGSGTLNIWGILNDKENVQYIRSFTYQGKDSGNNNKLITISPRLTIENESVFEISSLVEKLINVGLFQNDLSFKGTLTNFATGRKTPIIFSTSNDYILKEGYSSAEDAYGKTYRIISNINQSINIKLDSESVMDDRLYWNKIAASSEWVTYNKPIDTVVFSWDNVGKELLTREDCQAISSSLPDTNNAKGLEKLLFDSKIEYREYPSVDLLTTKSCISSSEFLEISDLEILRHDDATPRF